MTYVPTELRSVFGRYVAINLELKGLLDMLFFTVNTKSAEVAHVLYEKLNAEKAVMYNAATGRYTIGASNYHESINTFKQIVTDCLNSHKNAETRVVLESDTETLTFKIQNGVPSMTVKQGVPDERFGFKVKTQK